jgi:hypothetical protein
MAALAPGTDLEQSLLPMPMMAPSTTRRALVALAAVALAAALACSNDDGSAPPPAAPTRSYRMGFSGIPPVNDINVAIAAINMWSQRADAAMMSFELPWDSLLAGVPPETLVLRDQAALAGYYRAKGHELWIYLDPGNGLNRAGESTLLVNAGRSITEPAIQHMFRRYAVVIDSIIRPEHLGVALETNLIRGVAPAPLYAAVKQVANDAAADVRAVDPNVKLSVSVQVDWAWGRLGGGVYEGVAQDFVDFPFLDEVGLSSYPYLAGFAEPEEIPLNYYSRLLEGHTMPAMVTEGGWSSATLDSLVSSEAEEKRYIARQSKLLDKAHASAVFQLTFTDLDLSAFPSPGILVLFAHLGLVDTALAPKQALATWDALFARKYQP